MKHLLLSLTAISLLFASCKKSSSSSSTTTIPSAGWKLGTTSYTSAYVARFGVTGSAGTSVELTALDALPTASAPNKCTIYFPTYPTTGGTFHVATVGTTISLSATQIGVTAEIGATATYYASTGLDNIDATVTVSGGKIKVVIPDVWVKIVGGTDSLKLTGTVLEN